MIPPSLQALINLWTTVANSSGDAAYGVCVEGLRAELQYHPVVPLDELKAAYDAEDVGALIDRYTPPQPNPHPPGTYLWAREEHARGRRLRRKLRSCWRLVLGPDSFAMASEPGDDWDSFRFTHADFTATDWEVVL
jgi:hypothetical protein